jgi:uncharacterized protein (UPF0264 family)
MMKMDQAPPCRLLVSVRSEREAEAALEGGADLIDVKEPANGPLGRADDVTIRSVFHRVAGRRPVSAALGELADQPEPWPGRGLAFVKWGLAGCGGDWGRCLERELHKVTELDPGCHGVPVIYGDWRRAGSPPPEPVADFARTCSCAALLFDTWAKDGTSLFDWLSPAAIVRLRELAGVPIALAGSLGSGQIDLIRQIGPDWLAVRGAVCSGGRTGTVEANKVARLVQAIRQKPPILDVEFPVRARFSSAQLR